MKCKKFLAKALIVIGALIFVISFVTLCSVGWDKVGNMTLDILTITGMVTLIIGLIVYQRVSNDGSYDESAKIDDPYFDSR